MPIHPSPIRGDRPQRQRPGIGSPLSLIRAQASARNRRRENPSRKAAVARPSSSEANSSRLDSARNTHAAASWRASAARSGCRLRSRSASCFTPSTGSMIQLWLSMCPIRRRASAMAAMGRVSSRSNRASADTHSTRVPHQIAMSGSARSISAAAPLQSSVTSRGRTELLSQKITPLLPVPQGAS